MNFFILFGIFWVVCSVLCYGFNYNFFQSGFRATAAQTESRDFSNAVIWSFGGPLTLLVEVITGGTAYGLRFRRYSYINGIRQV